MLGDARSKKNVHKRWSGGSHSVCGERGGFQGVRPCLAWQNVFNDKYSRCGCWQGVNVNGVVVQVPLEGVLALASRWEVLSLEHHLYVVSGGVSVCNGLGGKKEEEEEEEEEEEGMLL